MAKKEPPMMLEVAGRQVRITSPSKVYFPDLGLTKLQLVQDTGSRLRSMGEMAKDATGLVRLSAIALLTSLSAGCGSETVETGPEEQGTYSFATLSVTLSDGMIRSCTSQFSADHDGHPFGEPAALVEITLDAGPEEATLFAYRTDEPPQNCPPMAEPFWSGTPGQTADFSDMPIDFGPGSAFTLQADCDACMGEAAFKATLKLKELEEL